MTRDMCGGIRSGRSRKRILAGCGRDGARVPQLLAYFPAYQSVRGPRVILRARLVDGLDDTVLGFAGAMLIRWEGDLRQQLMFIVCIAMDR